MLEDVQGERKSNLVITALLLFNAALTGIFAWNHLGGVFGELTGNPVGDILIRVLAVVLTVTAFDGAFHSWASIGKRNGLSIKQIATANTAKQVAMGGSIVASFAQVILGQTKVPFPTDLLFFIAVVALVSVAVILLLHVYWWDKFNDESFAATERSERAKQEATRKDNELAQKKAKLDAAIAFESEEAALELESVQAEQELKLTMMREEQKLRKQLATDKIEHQRAIAEQTRKNLMRSVYDSAAEIARIQGEEASRAFRASHGVTEQPVPFPHAGVTQMAADGVQAGSVIHRVVKDANGNVISEEELPDLYAPVTGNGTAPN